MGEGVGLFILFILLLFFLFSKLGLAPATANIQRFMGFLYFVLFRAMFAGSVLHTLYVETWIG